MDVDARKKLAARRIVIDPARKRRLRIVRVKRAGPDTIIIPLAIERAKVGRGGANIANEKQERAVQPMRGVATQDLLHRVESAIFIAVQKRRDEQGTRIAAAQFEKRRALQNLDEPIGGTLEETFGQLIHHGAGRVGRIHHHTSHSCTGAPLRCPSQ